MTSQEIEQQSARSTELTRDASELQSMRAILDDLYNRCQETALRPFADVAENCSALIDDIENQCVADEAYAIELLRESIEQLISGLESAPLPQPTSPDSHHDVKLPAIETVRPAVDIEDAGDSAAKDRPDGLVELVDAMRRLMSVRHALRFDQTPDEIEMRRLARAIDEVLAKARHLPMKSRLIDGMLVRVAETAFIIPAALVHTTMTEADHAAAAESGSAIPLMNPPVADVPSHTQGRPLIIVVKTDNGNAALPVDEIIDHRSFELLPLGRGAGPVKGVLGGTILPDEVVALVINPLQMKACATQGGEW